MSNSNMSVSGIYKITNTANGKIYVGSSVNIMDRWNRHKSQLRNNIHKNGRLQNAWNKYGADCFYISVIEQCFVFALIFREQYYINILRPEYNIALKAGSTLGVRPSPETLVIMSNVQKGKKHSLETRAKMSASAKGKTRSAETRAKMSIASKNQTPERRAKTAARNRARIFTTEILAKMSAAAKNISDETRAKMSASHMGKPSGRKGQPVPQDVRLKISASLTGKKLSAETIAKLSNSQKIAWLKRKQKDENREK